MGYYILGWPKYLRSGEVSGKKGGAYFPAKRGERGIGEGEGKDSLKTTRIILWAKK